MQQVAIPKLMYVTGFENIYNILKMCKKDGKKEEMAKIDPKRETL